MTAYFLWRFNKIIKIVLFLAAILVPSIALGYEGTVISAGQGRPGHNSESPDGVIVAKVNVESKLTDNHSIIVGWEGSLRDSLKNYADHGYSVSYKHVTPISSWFSLYASGGVLNGEFQRDTDYSISYTAPEAALGVEFNVGKRFYSTLSYDVEFRGASGDYADYTGCDGFDKCAAQKAVLTFGFRF